MKLLNRCLSGRNKRLDDSRLVNWIRRDWAIVALYLVATLIMTHPLAIRLDGQTLARRDPDTFVKLWDSWWLVNRAFAGEPLLHTSDLFYPQGVDLSFHSISWTVALGSWPISALVGQIAAYNVTILIAVFTTGYAAYLLIRPMVKHRAAAWLGGLVYTFAPYHIAHSTAHPDLVHLAAVPLALLSLTHAITRKKQSAALWAGIVVGISAFTSLYIMVFTLFTLLLIMPWLLLEKGRWRDRQLWSVILIFGVTSVFVLVIRLVPIFRNPDALTSSIDAKYTAAKDQTDLAAFVIPSRFNPYFRPVVKEIASRFRMNHKWPAYLGLIPLLLTAVAVTWRQRRRQVLPWFIAGVVFVLLSLGPILRFNGQVYESIPMPAGALTWFPPVRAVGRPDFFVLGILLPLAVCAAYGLDRVLIALGEHRLAKFFLAVALTALLLFEFWNGPFPVGPAAVNPFFHQVAAEEGEFALIQLPMGRQLSKPYVYQQTVHQRPIVEGLIARTPSEAYHYIENDYLLDRWRRRVVLECTPESVEAIEQSLGRLVMDGFRYVIVHRRHDVQDVFTPYLPVTPVYQDNELAAYALADVLSNPPCPAVE
ncbi:MAG: glycosyltransferase family 39 protein [Chloroflexota bacterium]|nr:MAG: glycosyltransferase family 39 protein [Chloroflexota bacterium]